MWVRSQNGEEILKVERFRFLPLENGEVNILAKLPRDTVILGTYCKDQAEAIQQEIWMTNDMTEYAMPPRWEDEEDIHYNVQKAGEAFQEGLKQAAEDIKKFLGPMRSVKFTKEDEES